MANRNENLQKEFGKRLRKIREGKGVSVGEFAEKAEITEADVHQLESENSDPTVTMLMRIAQVLQVELEILLGEKEYRPD